MHPLTQAALAAVARGWSVIPVALNKRPLIDGWKRYQSEAASAQQVATWARELHPEAWAVLTGAISGVDIIDFDGQTGILQAEAWEIAPHVRTGSGGYHLYLRHPAGRRVLSLNCKVSKDLPPGVDSRGDGGYAVFAGSNARGSYESLRDLRDLDTAAGLPPAFLARIGYQDPSAPISSSEPAHPPAPVTAWQAQGNPAAPPFQEFHPERRAGFVKTAEHWTREALTRCGSQGRNPAGFWLATQLRDNGFSEAGAIAALRSMAAQAGATNTKGEHKPYGEAEQRRSIEQAWSRAPRPPAARPGGPSATPARTPAAPTPAPLPLPPASPAGESGEGGDFIEPAAPPVAPPADPEADLLKRAKGRPAQKDYACRLTDLGNAQRLIVRHGNKLRYCHNWGKWLVWDGARWSPDALAQAQRLMIDTMGTLWDEYAQARKQGNDDEAKAIHKHAQKSEEARAITNALAVARYDKDVAIAPEQLDLDPWVLNVNNGTLSLITGQLRPHRQSDLITKLAPVTFDPAARCPRWEAFISQLMLGRPGLITYMQAALGYALTGAVSEKALFVLFGEKGNNGKTTLLEVMRTILGDYAGSIQIESLLQTRTSNGAQASPDIASLRGLRFVTTSEVDDGARLNEGRVKHLTGMGSIVARHLNQEQFSFVPTFKLFMDSNYKPVVKGQDGGIWNRLKCIPFDLQLGEAEMDRGLRDKLEPEAPGILNWLLDGLMTWHESGLAAPAEVLAATDDYKKEMDLLGHFLAECVDTGADPDQEQAAHPLFVAYRDLLKSSGEWPMPERRFAQAMRERGYHQRKTNKGNVYLGLRLSLRMADSGELVEVR